MAAIEQVSEVKEKGRAGDEELDHFYQRMSLRDVEDPLASIKFEDDDEDNTGPRDPPLPEATLEDRLKLFLNPYDGRFEDLTSWSMLFRDFAAGSIVAMIAIPLSMGFAIASNLHPVHGIVSGALAGFVGATFGGSKYQVYGPTAALIPIIAGTMQEYSQPPNTYDFAHSVLVSVSIFAGICLALSGLARLGRFIKLVPHSIIVGFTNGVAITIFMSEIAEVIGIPQQLSYHSWEKVQQIYELLYEFNIWCVFLAVLTFGTIKGFLWFSNFIPGPLIALGLCTLLSSTVLDSVGLVLVVDKYGKIPSHLLSFSSPSLPYITWGTLADLIYRVAGVFCVAFLESLCCARMADRLARNNGLPYNPNKELWGQGMVNVCVPLLNGFPLTGAFARTATNIKCGAVSPMAGIFKCSVKLFLAYMLAPLLEKVPMACIGGILMFVATKMISPPEILRVWRKSNFHRFLMIYCTIMIPLTDFLTGVVTSIVIYAALFKCFDKDRSFSEENKPTLNAETLRLLAGETAQQQKYYVQSQRI
jgi:SulP family sulfate permease